MTHSNTPTDGSDIDLHRVLLEIDDEVRAKRASGELPADLERELDVLFARFAPSGAVEGNFGQLLERAEQQSFVDLLAPNDSARKGVPQAKRLIQKAVRWYVRYVAEQFTGFSHTVLKLIRKLDTRVASVEQLAPPPEELAAAMLRIPTKDLAFTWQVQIVSALTAVRGRVLHVRAGSGELVQALRAAGVDVYGVEVSAELVSKGLAVNDSLDLRPDDERTHLRTLSPGVLAGLVLTSAPDVLARGAQVELVDLAALVLQSGGRLVLAASNPIVWGRERSPIEVDLAPGRPMSAETWVYLLEERGFHDIRVHQGAQLGTLDHVPGGTETVAGINANLDRLNDLLFPPSSALITATR